MLFSTLKNNMFQCVLFVVIMSILTACGSSDDAQKSQAESSENGSVAFQIVLAGRDDDATDRRTKAFSNCHDINSVTISILNGNQTIAKESWDCSDSDRKGTIDGITPGIINIMVQGVYVDADGIKTVFYQGRTSEDILIRAGETTEVDPIECQLVTSAPAGDADQDGDGFTENEGDCNDMDARVHPGATEIVENDKDDDCNAETPDSSLDIDNDGDGFTENEGDCDDTNATISPNADEVPYNDKDDDCNAETLDDDLDSDGYVGAEDCNDKDATVNPGSPEIVGNGKDDDCNTATQDSLLNIDNDGDGFTENEGDCDDTNVTISPNADEVPYNDKDDDCNAETLDDDLDSDGYVGAEDCNDKDATVNPGSPEIVGNGKDDDCNTATQDSLLDIDNDGDGVTENDGDCDDSNYSINPGAIDICGDGIDQDCSGTDTVCPEDIDDDGDGYTENQGDCDDFDLMQFPGAIEMYNDEDDDCDGESDENFWNKTFGTAGTDYANSIIQSNDGGYAFTGLTAPNIPLYKIDKSGNIFNSGNEVWPKIFGSSSAVDEGNSVIQTADGGYAIAGITYSYGAGSGDVWLIKTYPTGVREWDKTFGGTSIDKANAVIQTHDGGYIIVAETNSYGAGYRDMWLIKTYSDGERHWDRTYGNDNNDLANAIIQAEDGGYVIAGRTYAYSQGGVYSQYGWLLKINTDGDPEWGDGKLFGGDGGDEFSAIIHANDGDGYVVAGSTLSYKRTIWLVKTDSNGNEVWNKTFGSSYSSNNTDNLYFDTADSITHANDGNGYVITGRRLSLSGTSSGTSNSYLWLRKINEEGIEEWNRHYGFGEANSVIRSGDGGYVVAGETNGDLWIIKTDEDGRAPTTVQPR